MFDLGGFRIASALHGMSLTASQRRSCIVLVLCKAPSSGASDIPRY